MPRAAALWLTLAVFLSAAPGFAEPQSEVQRKCLREIHKRLGAVVKAQGRLGAHCLKEISRERLVGLSWSGCSEADTAGKVAKLAAATHAGRLRKCDNGELPTGLVDLEDTADVDTANRVARDSVLGLGDDILARPASIVRLGGDKLAAKCQGEVLKRTHKLLDVAWKEASAAANAALEAGAANGGGVVVAVESALAASARFTRAERQLVSKAEKKCAEVSAPVIFRGVCTAATTTEVAICAGERVRCRLCLALVDLEALPFDCDLFDDGTANLSCSAFL